MEPSVNAPESVGFRWTWFFAVHGLAFVIMAFLGRVDADGTLFWTASALFGLATLVLAVLAAEGKRYWRALLVLVGGAVLEVTAMAVGVIVAFAYHFTLF